MAMVDFIQSKSTSLQVKRQRKGEKTEPLIFIRGSIIVSTKSRLGAEPLVSEKFFYMHEVFEDIEHPHDGGAQ
jgi:hypothetical protein